MAELTSLETKAEGASTNKKYQIPNFFTQFWVLGSTHWINDVNKNIEDQDDPKEKAKL